MAVYSVAAGMVGVHAKTLVANTIDAVNFATDPQHVEVVSDGAAAIYVSVDGVDPTVAGANTYVLPAAVCARTIPHGGSPHAVKLISAGTPTYSVQVA